MAKHDDSKGNSFARSILRGVQLPTVIEIAKDSAEAGVDAMLEDSFAAIIPGVKILEYLVRLPSNVSNELFKRSVMGFIEAGEEAKPEEWQKFIEKLEEQKGGLDRAGDILMRSLANLDDQRKAKYLGMIYAAAAKGKISVQMMRRMHMILDRVYLPDLEAIAVYKWSEQFTFRLGADLLVSLQLITVISEDWGQFYDDQVGADFRYSVSDLGQQMIQILELE